MNCPNCNSQLPEGSRFCQECGSAVPQPEPVNNELDFDTIVLSEEEQQAFSAPQQPAYEAPQQPAYEAPRQPAYEAPRQTAFDASQQNHQFAYIPQQTPYDMSQQYSYSQPSYSAPQKSEITEEDLPEQFKPLGAWKYFLLQILFAIPIVGFVFLIIFSFKKSNINRRNFARSYWCFCLVGAVIGILFIILMLILGFGMSDVLDEIIYY